MKVLGLTGNIGTGKSTASSIIKGLNIKVIDCDIVSREVAEDKDILKQLENTFGREVINSDNTLNRKKLGEIVFSDKNSLKKLNSIMHPAMRCKIKEYINIYSKTEKVCVLDGAILIEAGFNDLVEDIILISSTENLQLKRVNKRDGHSYEYIKGIINSQMPLEEKEKYCKYIIYNNYTIEYLENEIKGIIKSFLDMEA